MKQRLCICGCGRELPAGARRDREAFSAACRMKLLRRRRKVEHAEDNLLGGQPVALGDSQDGAPSARLAVAGLKLVDRREVQPARIGHLALGQAKL